MWQNEKSKNVTVEQLRKLKLLREKQNEEFQKGFLQGIYGKNQSPEQLNLFDLSRDRSNEEVQLSLFHETNQFP